MQNRHITNCDLPKKIKDAGKVATVLQKRPADQLKLPALAGLLNAAGHIDAFLNGGKTDE